jgi:hypothetical protein
MSNRYVQIDRMTQAAKYSLHILQENGWNGGPVLTDEMLDLLQASKRNLEKFIQLTEADQLQVYYNSLEEDQEPETEEITRICGRAISDFGWMKHEEAKGG